MKFVDIIAFFVLFTIVNYCNTFVFSVSRKVIVFTKLYVRAENSVGTLTVITVYYYYWSFVIISL